MADRLVYVVDDDPLLLEALESFLTLSGWIVRCFRTTDEFKQQETSLEPGVLLLDVRMQGTSGIQFLERWPSVVARHVPVVMTGYGDIALAVKALRSGAMNFLEKPVPPEQLIEALNEAWDFLGARGDKSGDDERARQLIARLTPREREVLLGISQGKSNKAIAFELNLSVRTVEMHRAHMIQKTKVSNTAGLLALALSIGSDLLRG